MKSAKKFLNFILAALLVIFASLLYFNVKTKHNEVYSSSLAQSTDVDINSKVNEYMQEMQRKRTSAELNSLHRLQKGPDAIPRKGIDETDPAAVPIDRQIWKDSDQQEARLENQMDVIYRRIYEEEVAKKKTEQEKKQYALEFIENARHSGYHIQLSMDLEVISVQPIRNPQNDYDSLDIKN